MQSTAILCVRPDTITIKRRAQELFWGWIILVWFSVHTNLKGAILKMAPIFDSAECQSLTLHIVVYGNLSKELNHGTPRDPRKQGSLGTPCNIYYGITWHCTGMYHVLALVHLLANKTSFHREHRGLGVCKLLLFLLFLLFLLLFLFLFLFLFWRHFAKRFKLAIVGLM